MPLYDYRCGDCGHTFEALVRPQPADESVRPSPDGSRGAPPAECPKCGAATLERLPSVFAASSREKTQAIVAKKLKKEAHVGRQENLLEQKEIEEHRREDFGG